MGMKGAEQPKTAGFRPGQDDAQKKEAQASIAAQVRKMPSRPRSWANLSLLQLYTHRNAWADSQRLGHPNTLLAPGEGGPRHAGGAGAGGRLHILEGRGVPPCVSRGPCVCFPTDRAAL
jgi:hypothetical protein